MHVESDPAGFLPVHVWFLCCLSLVFAESLAPGDYSFLIWWFLMDAIHYLMQGFSVAFLPINLLYLFTGVFLGTIVGVLPGLGNAGAIAILLPISYYFSDAGALMLLAGIYY